MTRVRLYLRISSDREGLELGVDRQERACRTLAQHLGVEIVEPPYVDNDTGASTLSRKPRVAYPELLTDAADEPGSFIIAYSNSRLTRRPSEWDDLIRLYERHGVVIHTVASGSANLATADGRAVARTIAAWDAAEAERTGERVKLDVERRAKAGLFHGGGRAFGWTNSHELDPYESALLKEWVDRVIQGEELSKLAREATRDGVPTARGGKWKPNIIRQMMLNPRICGMRVFEDRRVPAVWPAIIAEPRWLQVKDVLEDPDRHSGGSPARVHLLTGLALCAACDKPVGSKLTISRKTGRRVQYVCRECGMSRRVEAVDTYVSDVVVDLLEHYDEQPAGADPEQVKIVERLRERIETVRLEFAEDDDADSTDLRATLRLLRGRLKREEKKLVPPRRHDVVRGVTGEEAESSWAALPLDRRRAIITALVEVRIRRSPKGRKPFDPATVEITER